MKHKIYTSNEFANITNHKLLFTLCVYFFMTLIRLAVGFTWHGKVTFLWCLFHVALAVFVVPLGCHRKAVGEKPIKNPFLPYSN
jgi:hypothetical protein